MGLPASEDPIGDIIRLRVLGHTYTEIQDHLQAQGYTITESRVKQLVNRVGEHTFDWIRENYLEEAAQTVLNYKAQIRDMMEQFNRRFVEAQQEYDEYKENREATLAGLFEEYRHDPQPDPERYARRAYAISEGPNIKRLATVMKTLSSEMTKWSEFGAKLDRQLQSSGVNITQVKIESTVNQLFEKLCSSCRTTLAELEDDPLVRP